MTLRDFTRIVTIDVPDGASHYSGDLFDDHTFYKCTQVGVAGDHWWFYKASSDKWVLASHHKPHWIEELPE